MEYAITQPSFFSGRNPGKYMMGKTFSKLSRGTEMIRIYTSTPRIQLIQKRLSGFAKHSKP